MRGRLTLLEGVGHGEPLSPFRPSPFQHIPTAPGLHSGPEAVGAGSFDIARLIGPFHNRAFFLRKLIETNI